MSQINIVNKKILVDSSVWVAFWLVNDSQHEKGMSLIKRYSVSANLYIHDIITMEVLTVLRYKKFPYVLDVYNEMLNGVYAIVDTSLFDLKTIKPFFEKFPKLSVVDAFLLYLCWDKNYTLLSLDQDLIKSAKKLNCSIIY